jgi:epoxyqueuosine reductase
VSVTAETVKRVARECGFELAGVAPADPPEDFWRYQSWVAQGFAGEMRYLTDRRAEVRRDVRALLPNARSVICVGKLYNQGLKDVKQGTVRSVPNRASSKDQSIASGDREVSPHFHEPGRAIISRYAWGADYHDVVRAGLVRVAQRLGEIAEAEGDRFDYKICVDTAPILERTFARLAGLGWIGKNTCLINEPLGSWFFLGEIVTSLDIAADSPLPDRCGTCSRCIEACPTDAFVWTSNGPAGSATPDAGQFANALHSVAPLNGHWVIDSARCIAYFTIELRGAIPEEHRAAMGQHVFGCDICQDVCPWNSRAPMADAFGTQHAAPSLEECARLTEPEFRAMFRNSPMTRAKHAGLLRNVAVAMGNSGRAGGGEQFREPLERLAEHTDSMVAEHARWGLTQLDHNLGQLDHNPAQLDHKMEKRVGHSAQLEAV